MPRKTKLTDDVEKRICDGLKLGMTYKAAAESQGITESTFWRWMREGEKARSGRKREFHQSVMKAVAESQRILLGHVHRGAEKSPQLALELLARRWPAEFGKKDHIRMTHEGNPDKPVAVAFEGVSEEALKKRLDDLEEKSLDDDPE